MTWGTDRWMSAIGRMNNSVERANQFHDERSRAYVRNEDAERASGLADAAFARRMAEQRMGQEGGQFDTRMNLLRELLQRQPPDFFGDGGGRPRRAGLVDRSPGALPPATMGPQPSQRGGLRLPFGLGDDDSNYLARLMRS